MNSISLKKIIASAALTALMLPVVVAEKVAFAETHSSAQALSYEEAAGFRAWLKTQSLQNDILNQCADVVAAKDEGATEQQAENRRLLKAVAALEGEVSELRRGERILEGQLEQLIESSRADAEIVDWFLRASTESPKKIYSIGFADLDAGSQFSQACGFGSYSDCQFSPLGSAKASTPLFSFDQYLALGSCPDGMIGLSLTLGYGCRCELGRFDAQTQGCIMSTSARQGD